MRLQPNPEAIPFVIAAVIAAGLARIAWRRRSRTPAPAAAFATMMAGEVAWALFEALELVIVDPGIKRLCFALRVAGTTTTLLGMLAFLLGYTGCERWLAPRRFAAAAAPMLALTLLALTNPLHHLYWRSIEIVRIGRFMIAMPAYGPAFWAYLANGYALAGIGAVLLARATYRSSGMFRSQAAIMLFGLVLPWAVSIIDMSRVFGFIHVDSVAIAFGVTGLAFLPAMFRYRLLDLTPVAWATVVRGMEDAVFVIDGLGRIVELNPAAATLLGREAHEILGAEASHVFAAWPALAGRLKRIGDQGDASFERVGPDPAGSSFFDARISRLGGTPKDEPLPGIGDDSRPAPPGADGWVLVLRDIGESKRAEAERLRVQRAQAARAEAEAANRSKDRLLATLSHELRTPLSPILTTITAILERPDTPEPMRPAMEMIRRNINLEVRLIDDLLDLTRVRGGKLHLKREAVDAHELIHRVVEICRDDLRAAGLRLALDLAAVRHDVDADPIRLQQVLWNLLKNAIKFTPAGGTVAVRSRDGGGVEGRAEDRSSGMLIIGVSDTGIGIDAGVLPRIFDLFDQGSAESARRSGGLGLGLTISRSIVEQHGGRLIAASEGEDRGSTFTIEMPTVRATAAVPTIEPVAAGEPAARRPLRILLVDDNDDTRSSLTELLARRGHDVRAADGVESAIRAAADSEIDLLISDIELVDGTGLQLIQALRSTHPVPAIALSGFGSTDDMELSRSAGFDVHLMKPVDMPALEEAIERVGMRPPAAAGVARASCP